MADSATWIGGAAGTVNYGDTTTPAANDWWTTSNWISPDGQPARQNPPLDIVINNSSLTNSINFDDAHWMPFNGTIYDSYTGVFSWTGTPGWTNYNGAVVSAGATLNMGGASANNQTAAGTLTFTVAPTGVVNLGNGATGQPISLSGGGTVNVTSDHNASWTVSGSTVNVQTPDGYTFNSLTADAASKIYAQGNVVFDTANYSFTGQIIETPQTYAAMSFTNDGVAGVGVVGTSIKLLGNTAGGFGLRIQYAGDCADFTGCTFSGDGLMNVTTGNYGDGAGNTLFSHGSTFAAMNTNTVGNVNTPGQMVIYGNLSLGKDGSGNNSQITAAVTGHGGVLGTDYTNLNVTHGGDWLGAPTYRYASGIVSCPDSATNALADTTLVVNITPGLTGVGINGTNLASDALYNQHLNVVTVYNTDLSVASTFGANIKINGGFATVTLVSDGQGGSVIQLSNIFSNPTLAGDANNDGQVNGADYAFWAANYGANNATWLQGDFNNDGQVNGADYAIWAANYGTGSGTSATPEPISMIILAIGGGLVAIKRRQA
jgi:hypothetical protein